MAQPGSSPGVGSRSGPEGGLLGDSLQHFGAGKEVLIARPDEIF